MSLHSISALAGIRVVAHETLSDFHKGERCFIIGNGPSLRETELTKLKGEFTFGLNRSI